LSPNAAGVSAVQAAAAQQLALRLFALDARAAAHAELEALAERLNERPVHLSNLERAVARQQHATRPQAQALSVGRQQGKGDLGRRERRERCVMLGDPVAQLGGLGEAHRGREALGRRDVLEMPSEIEQPDRHDAARGELIRRWARPSPDGLSAPRRAPLPP